MTFSFYTVSSHYCDFLRKADPKVPFTMDKKANRPFVGIILEINGFKYYAPLTSPKKKHLSMKNQVDFRKINDGEWGAINFNNMIPVVDSCLNKIDLHILATDSEEEVKYKNLLINQLSWCNSNKESLLTQAAKLYGFIVSGTAWDGLTARCCNFIVDEEQSKKYKI